MTSQTDAVRPSRTGARRLLLLSLPFALLTLAAGMLFLNNAVYIVRWWMAFHTTQGDAARLAEAGVCGLWPVLDWSAVDQSAATTFIPFFGFFLAWRGLVRAARGQETDENCFPYFPAYDSLNIALGLIGTLWGIILIGYYQMDTVAMGDLMQCLHTALFSTLMAVIWVYLVDRPILRPWLGRVRARNLPAPPEDEEPDADVIAVLQRLNEEATRLGEAWQTATSGAGELQAAAHAARASLDALRKSGQLAGMALTDELVGPIRRTVNELTKIAEDARAREEEARTALTEKLSRIDAEHERLAGLLAQLAESLSTCYRTQSALAEATERLRAERDAASQQAEQAKRQVNEVSARAAELEGKLRGETARADEAFVRLKREEAAATKRIESLRDENAALTSGKAKAEARAETAERHAAATEREAERSRKLLERVRAVFGDRAS